MALVCAVLLVASGHTVQADINAWTSLGPVSGLNFVAIDPFTPGTLYAGTGGDGVFSMDLVAACGGDCDANGSVAIEELVTLVSIALGNAELSACPASGAAVDIALIIRAVNNALSGCPSIDFYVAAAGALDGDGSVANPYRRITDAVARARADRANGSAPPQEVIQIHVAPGTYVGSFDPTQLQNNPEYEVLPIILNVPRLAVLGSTVLVRDERGLPTGAEPGSETIVEPDASLEPNQYLFLVTRTADGTVGDGVTLDGFALDGIEGAYPGAAVFIDRVSGFAITNNLIQRTAFGILTRLASGTIEGNLLADNLELATDVTGGSLVHPATVLVHANRATRNGAHGFGFTTSGYVNGGSVSLRTDPGQNTVALLEPLQTVFDRNNPDDLQNIPDTLTVTLSGNDASDNLQNGIRFGQIFPDFDYRTLDETQPLTSRLTTNVVGNTSAGNGYYGVLIEGGSTDRAELRQFMQTVAARFEGNAFAGNVGARALFTFTYWRVSAGLNSPIFHKFAETSTDAVTDADGELEGFDYDNPLTDELTGTILNNTLTVNGVEVPHGTSITPTGP